MAYKDKMSVEEMMERDDLLKRKKPTKEELKAYRDRKAKQEAEEKAKEDASLLGQIKGGFNKVVEKIKPSEPARQATQGVKNIAETIEKKKKEKKFGLFD